MSTIDIASKADINDIKTLYGFGSVPAIVGGNDLNDIKTTCNKFVFNCKNSPLGDNTYGFLQSFNLESGGFVPSPNGVVFHIFITFYTGEIFTRIFKAETWSDWIRFSTSTHTHSQYSETTHNHNDTYNTKTEVQSYLNNKQNNLVRLLNGTNIDTERGTWIAPVSEDGHGTRPTAEWYNIFQWDTSHFITQIAIGVNTQDRIYMRSRYGASTATFTTWRLLYNSGNKPTPADIGAATASHTHAHYVSDVSIWSYISSSSMVKNDFHGNINKILQAIPDKCRTTDNIGVGLSQNLTISFGSRLLTDGLLTAAYAPALEPIMRIDKYDSSHPVIIKIVTKDPLCEYSVMALYNSGTYTVGKIKCTYSST